MRVRGVTVERTDICVQPVWSRTRVEHRQQVQNVNSHKVHCHYFQRQDSIHTFFLFIFIYLHTRSHKSESEILNSIFSLLHHLDSSIIYISNSQLINLLLFLKNLENLSIYYFQIIQYKHKIFFPIQTLIKLLKPK